MVTAFSAGSYVNTNVNALNTQRYLTGSNGMLSKSLARLSSGYRINVAADDPSGLQISEQLRSQSNGINRAIQNSQEASNVIGIAEGAMIEINNILTKMKQLAIHAANEGATSPEQVAADQAEIDSGVQTIDRIANTTRYSDQYLLNGSKSLIFRTETTVNDPMDNKLIDVTKSRVDQVSQRGNTAPISLNFTGYDNANGMQAIGDRQARRAVIECDKTLAGLTVSAAWVPDILDGYITEQQRFILTGNTGSRAFSFLDGTHLGVVAESINVTKESTGIGATLTFDSSVSGSQVDLNAMGTDGAMSLGSRLTGQAAIYNDKMSATSGGVSGISVGTDGANFDEFALVPGMNLDADGRMYLKWLNADTYVAFKDENMTMEIGRGRTGSEMTSANNSGIAKACITINAGTMAAGDQTVLQFGQQFEFHDGATDGSVAANGMNLAEMHPLTNAFGLDLVSGASCISGVRLQDNTSTDARLYFSVDYTTDGSTSTVKIYADGKMLPENLVAEGTADVSAGAPYQVTVNQTDYKGEPSGIYATLSFSTLPTGDSRGAGTLEFNQLGLRVYSEEYGSEQYLRVQNLEGNLLGMYPSTDSYELLPVKSGETLQASGGDALLAVNGQVVYSHGLVANVSSQNYSGSLTFYGGELGMTTIAQVGQDIGALASRGGALQTVAPKSGENPLDPTSAGYLSWATNGRHNTSEEIHEFVGGMQYQLGEGENNVERTIYSIPSMAVANLGKSTLKTGVFSLQDVLSGGPASLMNDPISAMRIIRQAIDDVTGTRARLGAFQKDMLHTNINSMEVTVENIVKTESYIRDTNMATESTEYTKNQILVNAGTSMLAQANKIPQSVLSLLG